MLFYASVFLFIFCESLLVIAQNKISCSIWRLRRVRHLNYALPEPWAVGRRLEVALRS